LSFGSGPLILLFVPPGDKERLPFDRRKERDNRFVLALGIESTCDETGVALVEDARRVVANRVLSQVPLHERFGGVVPEIASRAHVIAITRLIEKTLADAGLSAAGARSPVDVIAAANRPGLIGSLLVGVTAAKALSFAWGTPLVGVDHIHAHIYSAAMRREGAPEEDTAFPAVSLVVSGGHTALYASASWTRHELLGATTDDAAGEAFDKVASILGLGYPGGPAIARAAEKGNPAGVVLPRTLLGPDSLDFSFSGIKTAVLYQAKGQNAARGGPLRPALSIPDMAAGFQEAVVDVLITKLGRAVRREAARSAIVAGGVAANRRLRERLEAFSRQEGIPVFFPDIELCTDNGAMIAGFGCRLFAEGREDGLLLDAHPMGSLVSSVSS
jgi:N6-L-threonylcarbamoyladenine synthase